MTATNRRPIVAMPSRDSLADNEIAVAVTGRPDSFDRVQFFAWWLDDHLTPDGVRGQVFHTVLANFVRDAERRGRTVSGINESTRAMLAAVKETRR